MNPRRIRAVALAGAAILLAASAAGCITTDQPTPIYVYLTPSPEPTVEATPAPTQTATPSPSAEDTSSAGPSAEPSPSGTPGSDTSLSVAASGCVGSAANQAFFDGAAAKVKASVFCATGLPKGWILTVGNWRSNASGGWVDVTYRYKQTSQTFEVKEGAFCLNANGTACTGGPLTSVKSGVSFGGMATDLVTNGGAGELEMILNPGKYNAYFLLAHNVPQGSVIAIGAGLRRVVSSSSAGALGGG